MTNSSESGRNKHWQDWYPTVTIDRNLDLSKSPYGEPNQETLAVFARLPKGRILDVGGGEGRYGVPLAKMGHDVVVTDVDAPHLERLQEKKALLNQDSRNIHPVFADATERFPVQDESFDGALNAGFGYLIPPEVLDPVFGRMTEAVKPGGIVVFEFATDRDRRTHKDGPSLIGAEEKNYSYEEGFTTLQTLYEKHGVGDLKIQRKVIHFEEPYYMHNELIIAHGKKR